MLTLFTSSSFSFSFLVTDIEHSDGTCHCLADCAGPPEAKSEEFVVERYRRQTRRSAHVTDGGVVPVPRIAHRAPHTGGGQSSCVISSAVAVPCGSRTWKQVVCLPPRGLRRATREVRRRTDTALWPERGDGRRRRRAPTRQHVGMARAASVERVSTVAGRPAPGTPATCSAAAAWS